MDKVRLETQERLDIPDALALQTLCFDYDLRELGGSLGLVGAETYGGGLLTEPAYDVSGVPNVLFGPFMALGVDAAGSGRVGGRVLRTSAALSVNIGGAPGLPWIWAVRTEVASTIQTRRQWDTGTGAEIAFSPTTRYLETITLAASVARPAGDAYPIAKVTGWTGPVPTITLMPAWDRFWSTLPPSGTVNSLPRPVGLRELLTDIRSALARIVDSGGTLNWNDSTATRGLNQIDTDIDDLVAKDVDQDILSVKASGWYTFTTGPNTLDLIVTKPCPNMPVLGTYSGVGNYRLTLLSPVPLVESLDQSIVVMANSSNQQRYAVATPVIVGANITAIDVSVYDVSTGAADDVNGGFRVMLW